MSAIFAGLILIRPFISSIAYPAADLVFTGVSLLFLILFLAVRKPVLPIPRSIMYPAGMFVFGLWLSLVGSADTATGIIEIYKTIPSVLVFFAAAWLDATERRTVIFAFICSAVAVCACAAYQRIFGFAHLRSYMAAENIANPAAVNYLFTRRPFFPFVTPNALAGYCALILPLCLSERRFYWAALPLAGVILLTQSLGALLGLLAGIYLTMLFVPQKVKTWRITLVAGLCTLFVLVFLFRITGPSLETTSPGLLRIRYWREALAVIHRNPITGAGPGNMNLPSSLYAHNTYLQLWAETGILSLTGFIWLCASILSAALRRDDARTGALTPLLVCSFLIFLVHNLVDFTFFLPEVGFAWWCLAGMLSRGGRTDR